MSAKDGRPLNPDCWNANSVSTKQCLVDAMTASVLTADTPIPAPRREWGAALRALRRLLRDKEDTRQVFEIMRALSGDSMGENYRRL